MSTAERMPRVWYCPAVPGKGPQLHTDISVPAVVVGGCPPAPGSVELRSAEYRSDYDSWHDAGLDIYMLWTQLRNAPTPIDAAYAMTQLNDLMSDFASWLPGYDPETGEVRDPRAEEQ